MQSACGVQSQQPASPVRQSCAHLSNASLRPRCADGSIGDVKDDPVLLLRLRKPTREFERPHPAERMPTQNLHHGRLVEVARRGADRFEGVEELGCKGGDGDVAVDGEDGDGLRRSLSVRGITKAVGCTHLEVEVVLAHLVCPSVANRHRN